MLKGISNLSKDNRSALFASVMGGLALSALFLFFFQKPAFLAFDALQRLNLIQKQNEVALIVLDQKSLDSLQDEGVVFPLPRQIFGAVAEVAAQFQARALVFDILFTEDSSYGVEDDATFADMLSKSKVPVFFPAASSRGTVKDPIPPLKQTATGLGRVDFENDSDGTFRRVPEHLEDVKTLPAAVSAYLQKQENLNQKPILESYNEIAFPVRSVYEVLKYYRDTQDGRASTVDLSEFRNKIWVIGYTAPGLYDLKPMPADKKAPGMLIVATALANRLTQAGLATLNGAVYFSILLFFILIAVFSINRLSEPVSASAWLSAQTILLPTLSVSLGWKFGYWVDPITSAVGILSSGGIMLIWNFRTAWRDRLKLAKSLKHSMSEEMVDLIRTGEVQVSRFGEEREVTVLFSDLAGYTNLSERSTPQEMVAILNAYLDEVVELITSHSGYIDKFIGDAVMVIWGAPIKQENHAQLAFETATKFNDICEKFNERMKKENPNFENLITRIGLHTGKAIVGNIGASKRHNYTAIGDTVNQASRLEGIGKNYDVCLTLSEDIVKAVGAENRRDLLELDRIILKGKTRATRLFTILQSHQLTEADQYKKALDLYFSAKWAEALGEFQKIKNIPAAVLMAKRCEVALVEGKLKNWVNGAWMYDSK